MRRIFTDKIAEICVYPRPIKKEPTMNEFHYTPNLLQRSVQRLAMLRSSAWLLSHTLHHLDPPVYRLTGGSATLTSVLSGLPIITLVTTGAKSGQPRAVPLIAIPHANDLYVIASNWGGKSHPAWYYNLRANPECTVEMNGRTLPHTAQEISGETKATVWQTAVRLYPGYAAYQKRAPRDIPVFKLLADS